MTREKLKKIWKKLKPKMPIFLIIYVVIICGTIAMFTRYNSAPDERMRLDLVYYVSDNLELPDGRDEAVRDAEWGFSYASEPMTSQIFSGLILHVAKMFTHNGKLLLFAPRIVSVVWIAVFVFFVLKISKKLFKDNIYRVLFIVFVALIPQILYLGGYVNNDAMGLATIAMVIYSWLLGIEKKWNYKVCIFFGLSLGLLALSYYNAYGYILTSVFLFFGINIVRKVKISEVLKKGLVISAVALLVGGWWFVRSAILYDGDILGLRTIRESGEKYAIEELRTENRKTPKNEGKDLPYMFWDMEWTAMVRRSFYGNFGYMKVPMNYELYMFYELMVGIGLIGVFIHVVYSVYLKKAEKKVELEPICETELAMGKKEKKIFVAVMTLSAVIVIALSVNYSYGNDFQPQGRYILPMIIPLMFFAINGLEFILRDLKKWKRNLILGIFIAIGIFTPYYVLVSQILSNLGY